MDRILFGDNQFFGVNHMSEEKARTQALKFKDTKAIIDVLDSAYNLGVRTFMCTTHDRIAEICEHIRANPNKYRDFEIYPCMPYAHKYNNAVAEKGMLGALKHFIPGSVIGTLARGGKAAITVDAVGIMKLQVDAEMKMFTGIKTSVIFLQNVMVDLLIGLGFGEMFAHFSKYIRNKYNAEPGFITMNLPRLLEILDGVGIENPVVCSNINKIGFRMCGGIDAYEQVIRENKFRCIAMSIFASGAIPPKEAIDYVCSLTGIQSIVFGASSAEHIRETKELIDNSWRAV